MSGTLKVGGVPLATHTGTDGLVTGMSWGSSVPAGTIIQVLQTVKTDKDSWTGSNGKNTYILCPAQGGSGVFQQAITITGSNKVLIHAHTTIGPGTANHGVWWALLRGAAVDTAMASCTRVAVGTDPSSNQSNATHRGRTVDTNTSFSSGMTWLDSPPSAGTYYYKLGVDAEGTGTGYINRTAGDGDAQYYSSVPSSITLMEVAA